MKITFIATVLNEENSIIDLLDSILAQSLLPDEVIIVDGGSSDRTVAILQDSKLKIQNYSPKLKIIEKRGNRSIGRNEAIKNASGDVIVCSDAGCILDKDWVKNITQPFFLKQTDVVAGYYEAKSKSIFQKCLATYVLVMSDRVNTRSFLPASRSMAFRKTVWEKVGGFPESFSYNEDYVFAQTIKKNGFNITFVKDAIVYWIPRKNFKEAFLMFFKFAFGDAESQIVRPKVVFLFIRYVIALTVGLYVIFTLSVTGFIFLLFAFFSYLFWSICKNYKYVKAWQAFFILPSLQIVSDIAVMLGTISGFINRFIGGGYSKNTLRGISWIGALRFFTRIISSIRILIIAHLLSPAQVGVFGVVSLSLSFLEILTETGVNVVLIQEKKNINSYISAAWVVSIFRGIFISFLIFFAAPYVALFFNSKESLHLLQLSALVPFIRGFINPSVVKFQKELQFKNEFWYRFFIFVIDSATAIIFTLITKNPIGLVYGLIAGVIFETIISFFIVKPIPSFKFDKTYLSKIFHRGKWVTLSGIFSYFFQNGDNIIVGKLLGMQSLGLYQMAYSIAILPISEVADVISRVTFPVYAKISDNNKRLKNAFIRITSIVALATGMFGVLLFILSQEIFIRFLFGEKWISIVPLLQVLVIFGVIRAISNSTSSVFMALHKQNIVASLSFLSFLFLAILIFPFINMFGLIGAAFAVLTSSVIVFPIAFYLLLKIFNKRKDNAENI